MHRDRFPRAVMTRVIIAGTFMARIPPLAPMRWNDRTHLKTGSGNDTMIACVGFSSMYLIYIDLAKPDT
jgi:hypothetical protein